jgi:hypothetical protein
VVGTYDGATQRLYVNGSEVAGAPLTGAITVNANALDLGSWREGSEPFNGTIDEVAVYAGALSAARVAAHYQAGSGAQTVALGSSTAFAGGSQLASTFDDSSAAYSIGSPPRSYAYFCHLPVTLAES